MSDLVIGTIAFNVPWTIAEQIRLFRKYVRDDHRLVVFDNSTHEKSALIESVCSDAETQYVRLRTPKHEHDEALNAAALFLVAEDTPRIGFVDHDLWPAAPMELSPLVDQGGFLCVGQKHAPTGHLYPWPGCLFMSRAWLASRPLDFRGIRGQQKRDDGDCGSGLWPLFADEDWRKMFLFRHGYEAIREPDDFGMQSWGLEHIGDFLHATNVSNWMDIPNAPEREQILRERVAAL